MSCDSLFLGMDVQRLLGNVFWRVGLEKLWDARVCPTLILLAGVTSPPTIRSVLDLPIKTLNPKPEGLRLTTES